MAEPPREHEVIDSVAGELLRNRVFETVRAYSEIYRAVRLDLGEDVPDDGPRLKASALVIRVDYGRACYISGDPPPARPGRSWPVPRKTFCA
jgi:hypothetical protein